MAATDARPVPIKNTAFRVTFPILDNDGDPVTGAAGLDSEVSKDGAAFADCTNEATEISAGIYYLDLTSTEMNADTVAVQVKTSTTDAKTSVLIFYPQETGDIKVDVQSLLGTAWLTPGTAGTPDVNVKLINGTAAATPGASGGLLISGSNSGTTTFGALTVTGATTLTGAVSMGSTLGVTGTVTFNAFTVTNATTLTGAVSLGSTLGVTGATSLAAVSTSGTVTLNALTVTNATTLSGAVALGSTFTVTGATSLAAVTASGTVTFNAFTVTNTFSMSNMTIIASSGHALRIEGVSSAVRITGATAGGASHSVTITNSGTGAGFHSTGGTNNHGMVLVGNGTGTGLFTNITGDITGALSGSVGSVVGNVGGNVDGSVNSVSQPVVVTSFVAGAIDSTAFANGAITAAVIADGAIDAATFAAGAIDAAAIANGAIDRATFAADTGMLSVRSNTAQAGGATTITLDASASAVNDFYNDSVVYLTGGTGAGQARTITDYVGATKVATVATWGTNPDNTSTFAILPNGAVTATIAAADIRSAVGLASANLDTQLAALPTAAENAAEADTVLSGSHGAGTWGSAGGGTGARSVTITVNDGATALENARVRFTEGLNTFLVLTNASGIATFALDDATYTVTVTKPGYTFTPTTMIVNGTETATYSMTAVAAPAAPADVSLCRLHGYLETMDGLPAKNLSFYVTLVTAAGIKSDKVVVGRRITIRTNEDGRIASEDADGAEVLYHELQRNDLMTPSTSTYTVTFLQAGLNGVSMTLNATTKDIASLIS